MRVRRAIPILFPTAVALGAVLFYAATTAPGLAHSDQAIAIDAMCAATLESAATHHNLTALAGYLPCRLGTAAGIAYRCNLASGVIGGLAIGLFFAVARRIGGPVVGLLASLFLLLSHSMWWHSTVAEVYAVNALLSAGVLYGLVRYDQSRDVRWFWSAAAVAGLGVFNHVQMGFWLPGLLAASWLEGGEIRQRLRRLVKLALAYGAGFLPYALLFTRDTLARGGVSAAAREATGGEFSHIFFTVTFAQFVATVRLFMLQWGWPSLFLVWVAWGVLRLWRGPEWRCTRTTILVGFLVNTGFFAFYPTWDKFAFLLPSFIIASVVGAVGLAAGWTVARRRAAGRVAFLAVNAAALAWAPVFFARLPSLARESKFWSGYGVYDPLRLSIGDGRYLSNPDKSNYTGVERYISALEERLPPHAVLIDHPAGMFFQFRHAQTLRGWRPDVSLRVFVPSFSDPRRWPRGFGPKEAVSVILADQSAGPVYAASLRLGGFSEVVERLLDQGWTFVEHPVIPEASVWELTPGATAARRPLVASLAAGGVADADGATVTFVGRNPPLRLGVTWRTPDGQPLGAPAGFNIPFDSPPVFAAAPSGAAKAELDVFGVAAGEVPLPSAGSPRNPQADSSAASTPLQH
jgi:hypothetical protein